MPGPSIKVKGFVTDLDVTGMAGTITIDSIDDGEVTLRITGATEIEDPIAVEDFVKAKYNPGLVAKKIEIEDGEFSFRGTIVSFTSTELVLDEQTFLINLGTEAKDPLVVGAEAKVDARPVGGSLIAVEIEVEGLEYTGIVASFSPTELELEDGTSFVITGDTEIDGTLLEGATVEVEAVGSGDALTATDIDVKDGDGDKPEEFDLKGTITSLSDTAIELDGSVTVTRTPETKIKGILALDAKVKVEAFLDNGDVVASEIKVKEESEEEEEDSESDIEFKGIITALSSTEIELDGSLTVLRTPQTQVKGSLFLGVEVKVGAFLDENGDLTASEIKVEELELEGIVAGFSSTELELESGVTIVITTETDIEGVLSEEAEVEVEYFVDENGNLVAEEIKVEEEEDE